MRELNYYYDKVEDILIDKCDQAQIEKYKISYLFLMIFKKIGARIRVFMNLENEKEREEL